MSEEAKNVNEADPTGSVRVDAGVGRSEMRVFKIHDGEETVWAVTDTEEKANTIYEDYMGTDYEASLEIYALADDEIISITDDDGDEESRETKTAKEWAESYGVGTGFLAASIW